MKKMKAESLTKILEYELKKYGLEVKKTENNKLNLGKKPLLVLAELVKSINI